MKKRINTRLISLTSSLVQFTSFESDGCLEGLPVTSFTVGKSVLGLNVGLLVGSPVGLSVTGNALGDDVGLSVTGDLLGKSVGLSVTGDLLGKSVGLSVTGL